MVTVLALNLLGPCAVLKVNESREWSACRQKVFEMNARMHRLNTSTPYAFALDARGAEKLTQHRRPFFVPLCLFVLSFCLLPHGQRSCQPASQLARLLYHRNVESWPSSPSDRSHLPCDDLISWSFEKWQTQMHLKDGPLTEEDLYLSFLLSVGRPCMGRLLQLLSVMDLTLVPLRICMPTRL